MDFTPTEEQLSIRDLARQVAQKELRPRAAHYDKTGEFPWENVKKLAEVGLTGLTYPEEYGGSGQGVLTLSLVMEEIAAACANTAMTLIAHLCTGSRALARLGTREQKEAYMPRLARGEILCCQASTEPGAGTDAAAIATTATRDGDHYVLNGQKTWITNLGVATLYTVFARTTPMGKNRNEGISAFLIEKGTPGFTIGKPFDKLGIRANPTGELFFENCRIHRSQLLGKEGQAFNDLKAVFNATRLINATNGLGISRAAFEASVEYAKQRVQFGKPIASFQGIRWIIAEMAAKLDMSRVMIHRAAWMVDQDLPCRKEISMAKLLANQTAVEVTNAAMQIHGAYGYSTEYPVERHLRDARVWPVGGGTMELQRNIIAHEILGSPGRGR
jgi:alkylation response protein AidB-like acyl-CoA dehydrogenase